LWVITYLDTLWESVTCNLGARWGWVVNATPRPLYPGQRPNTHCIGGEVGAMAGRYEYGKSRPYRHSIPGPSSL